MNIRSLQTTTMALMIDQSYLWHCLSRNILLSPLYSAMDQNKQVN